MNTERKHWEKKKKKQSLKDCNPTFVSLDF